MNTQNTKIKAESGKRESGNEGDNRASKESGVRSQEPEGEKVGLVELVPPIAKEGKERTELVAVLEGCGVSVAGFDALRSDSYEKHLSRRNLAELEAFYRRLMNPGEGYGRIRQECLAWGIGSHHMGKLPSVRTLWGDPESGFG